MVVSGRRATAEGALIVPDPEAWELWGVDLEAQGFEPAASPAAAKVLVVPARVPDALVSVITAAWRELPEPRRLVELPGAPLTGPAASQVLAATEAERSTQPDGEPKDEHEHDHGDMMAITGEPSADGLVMEPIETALGPLAPGLSGGLVVGLELDGDVVASCEPRPTLRADEGRSSGIPDPLSPVAWAAALAEARELRAGSRPWAAVRWRRVAAVECERAFSHLLWLRRLGAALGWRELGEAASGAARALAPPAGELREYAALGFGEGRDGGRKGSVNRAPAMALATVRDTVDGMLGRLRRSRRLTWRTHGRATLAPEVLAEHGVGGPTARASGVRSDARLGRQSYLALGFELRTESEGDARARILQRVGEASDALALALAALERAESEIPEWPEPAEVEGPVLVESPRGPVAAAADKGADGLTLSAPGAAALYGIAGHHVTGLEWSSALIGLASFDLSPWAVQ